MVTPPWIFGRATGKEATPHCHEVLACPSAAPSGPLAVGTPPCTLKPLSNHRMLKPHRTSGSRGIWMSRLKYSMSEAFLKKLLRLEGGRKEKRLEGDVGRLDSSALCQPRVPAKLLVEAVAVALQGVSWQTCGNGKGTAVTANSAPLQL